MFIVIPKQYGKRKFFVGAYGTFTGRLGETMGFTTGSVKDQLAYGGFIYPAMLGIQPDLNVAWLREKGDGIDLWREASFCDHNCVRATSPNPGPREANGAYDCFAATSLNKGINPKSMAGFEPLSRWMQACIDGQRFARDDFLREDFTRYCDDRKIPPAVAEAYRQAIASDQHEINLFGGNPELNDACTDLITHFRGPDRIINITTTGGRVKREPVFAKKLKDSRPDKIAVSADDLTPEEVVHYVSMNLDELTAAHAAIPPSRGQDRKALEGIWVAKYAENMPDFPPVLFNTVIHERNVHEAIEMIEAMERHLPNAIINPYIGQSSMYNGAPLFGKEHLEPARKVIHHAIQATLAGRRIPKRLPFYFALEAVFRRYEGQPEKISRALAGYDIWQCYRENACWYLQFGRNEQPIMQIQGLKGRSAVPDYVPGGHLGCTWNPFTVTESGQIFDAQQVRRFLRGGMSRLAAMAKVRKCLGCDMPRLLFHAISIELGLDPELLDAYYGVRSEFAPHLFN